MYLPPLFREDRIEELRSFMREYPLATLITVGEAGIEVGHAPLLYDPEPAPFGTLRGHWARANSQWRTLVPAYGAVAVFQGPQAYVSPSFYPSKTQHGRVVPTWNYAVVHAHAAVTVVHDPEWLRGLVTRLTDEHEASFAAPWKVTDAPSNFIDGQLNAIVGIELKINKLEGKWKASQNRDEADRVGVISGLESSTDFGDREMANFQRQHSK